MKMGCSESSRLTYYCGWVMATWEGLAMVLVILLVMVGVSLLLVGSCGSSSDILACCFALFLATSSNIYLVFISHRVSHSLPV